MLLSLMLWPSAARAQQLGWTGAAEASANVLFGAASGRVVSVGLNASRADSARELRGDAQFTYADQRDRDDRREVRARSSRAAVALDIHPFDRVSPFGFGTVETSLQQRLASRVSGGAGAKWTLMRRGNDDVSISLALLGERSQVLDPEPGDPAVLRRLRGSARFRVRQPIGSALRVTHVTFYQPTIDRPGRYTIDSNTGLALTVTKTVALTMTLRDRYDSEARGRGARSNHDGQLLFGVRATF